MITSRFPLGDVSFSAEYFSTLVGEATKQCYGVAAMTPRDLTDVVKSVVRGNDYSEKGVRVTQEEGRLVIELHIAVSYGLNISTAARSFVSSPSCIFGKWRYIYSLTPISNTASPRNSRRSLFSWLPFFVSLA